MSAVVVATVRDHDDGPFLIARVPQLLKAEVGTVPQRGLAVRFKRANVLFDFVEGVSEVECNLRFVADSNDANLVLRVEAFQ